MSDQERARPEYGEIQGPYTRSSIRRRIEALFLDNIGKILTREQIIEVATDPDTGYVPENWHQRLSELRVDHGYTILSSRDRDWLGISEYMMPHANQRATSSTRITIKDDTWEEVLERAGHACEWEEAGRRCGLEERDRDPVGGGTVRLTPDHKTPHSYDPAIDPDDPDAWQALCGRHQVVKKNYWDHRSGSLNTVAIVQAATAAEKRKIYEFLKEYFGDG